MSRSKREEAIVHLRHLRLELREMATMLNEENLLPEAGEIKALYSQLEALHDVVKGVKKKKPPVFEDDNKAA